MNRLVAATIGLAVAQFSHGSLRAQEVDTIYQIPLKSGTLTPEPSASTPPAASRGVLSETLALEDVTAAAPDATSAAEAVAAERVIIQFERLPGQSEIRELAERGISLQEYIGGFSYFATGDASVARGIEASDENIRVIQPLLPSQKIHPDLARPQEAAEETGAEPTAVTVQLFSDADLDQTIDAIRRMEGQIIESSRASFSLIVTLPADEIDNLAALSDVKFIEPAPPPRQQFNDGVRESIGAANAESTLHLIGKDIRIGVWDGGVVAAHGDFSGRLIVAEPAAAISSHATHVAGTLAGDGSGSAQEETGAEILLLSSQINGAGGGQVSEVGAAGEATGPVETEEHVEEALRSALAASPEMWRGVAPGAEIVSYFWDQSADDHEAAIRDQAIQLSQNSWGFGVDSIRGNCSLYGDYTTDSAAYDRIVRGLFGRPLPIVFAAGNERNDGDCGMSAAVPFENYANITPPQTAKNVITVGAINSDDGLITEFSSYGPTDDGRLKPDIVAAGCQHGGDHAVTSTVPVNGYGGKCGTSMAAPAVSGAIALLMEARSGDDSGGDLLPSSYRALLIHGAKDIERPGPDYSSGYGRIDIIQSVKLLQDKSLTESTISETGQKRVAMLQVPAEVGTLRVTLVWDDEPASPNVLTSLVNDLELQLLSPTQETLAPWILDPADPAAPATRGTDHTNVVEQVAVDAPLAGSWLVEITGSAVPKPPQAFSLVVSTE